MLRSLGLAKQKAREEKREQFMDSYEARRAAGDMVPKGQKAQYRKYEQEIDRENRVKGIPRGDGTPISSRGTPSSSPPEEPPSRQTMGSSRRLSRNRNFLSGSPAQSAGGLATRTLLGG